MIKETIPADLNRDAEYQKRLLSIRLVTHRKLTGEYVAVHDIAVPKGYSVRKLVPESNEDRPVFLIKSPEGYLRIYRLRVVNTQSIASVVAAEAEHVHMLITEYMQTGSPAALTELRDTSPLPDVFIPQG